jgi:polyisoprenoid-binding protein YceI
VTDATQAQADATKPGGNVIRYSMETRVSKFTVQAFAGGMLSAIGHDPTFAARDYSGEIECDPATGAGASLKLSVKAMSLQVSDDFSSKDKKQIEETMQAEVLESAKFPDIVYECSPADAVIKTNGDGPFDVTLNGNLTLHGATRRLTIKASVIASPDSLRAFGDFPIRQSDFNIKPVSVAGGSLKVKDELKCTFDFVARPAAN